MDGAASADELPKKSGTQPPGVLLAIVVVTRTPVRWRAEILAGQSPITLQTEFLHPLSDDLEIVSRSGSGHGSSF
jgi:hypothetical protein